MSSTDTARDDLAYMRALVDAPGNFQHSFGATYFAAGLCYGLQMVGHAAQLIGWIPGEGPAALVLGFGPTVAFLALLLWIMRRDRASGRPSGGAVAKAVAAMLSSVGLANLVLIVVVGVIAWKQKSILIWLIYPCTVMVFQGAAWLAIYALRRRGWTGAVAAGWFATAVVMALGVAYQNLALFIGAAGVGFLAFMIAPGLVIMRQSRVA